MFAGFKLETHVCKHCANQLQVHGKKKENVWQNFCDKTRLTKLVPLNKSLHFAAKKDLV